MYTGVFDYKDWGEPNGLGLAPFEKCPEKRCFAFKPYFRQKAEELADGVLVHGPNLLNLPDRNAYKRNRNQLWLYYALESPRGSFCSMHYKPTDLDDWFNITATYKRDSNFIVNYAPVDNKDNIQNDLTYLFEFKKLLDTNTNPIALLRSLSSKTKKASVVWFVSHCETSSRRELFITEMRKHIDIDIYGKCGSYFDNSLPDPCAKALDPVKCFNNLLNSYKFYLSFENSLCDDYITEKYWKIYKPGAIFQVNMIPVVRGAKQEQFEKVAPSNSFINAHNYESPKSLANYLNYLNNNNTAYFEYFQWKTQLYKNLTQNLKHLKVQNNLENRDRTAFLNNIEHSPFCLMCSMLHNKTFMNSESNKIWKLSEWFSPKSSCWDEDEARRIPFWFMQFLGFCF